MRCELTQQERQAYDAVLAATREDLAARIGQANAITLLKQTSLATLVAVPEMTLLTQRIFSNNFKFIEPIFVLAVIYLMMTSVLLVLSAGVEYAFRLRV